MQDPPLKRPRLTPHEPAHILAARARAPVPKERPEFQDLLVGDFASGKASAARVPGLTNVLVIHEQKNVFLGVVLGICDHQHSWK